MTSSRDKPRDAAANAKVVPLTQPSTRPLRPLGKRPAAALRGADERAADERESKLEPSEQPVTIVEAVEAGAETLPPSAVAAAGPPRRAGDLLPGTRVEHFEVLRLLGRGGMGDVYLARDTQLGRRIALKLVRQRDDSSADEVARAMAEARLTARCNHPHIVAIHAVGEHQGRPFMALEYLEGETLQERLSRERPAPQATLRIGLAIAEALAAAHENGVLHRDLKPGNVMLPQDGRLRVVDFGLARPITAASDAASDAAGDDREGREQEDDRWVEESRLCGTPRYMAPEQWEQLPSSDKTDIFALGVMLFEMLAGDSPFAEPGISLARLATLVTLEPPKPLQAKGAPPLLAETVTRCLEREAELRPSAAELAEVLGQLLSSSWANEQRQRCPFVGLLPFAEDRAAAYFGRGAEVAACVERLRDEALLPVVGPSGAGKTSFVHAGVIPRLREQDSWVVLSLRPGGDPFRALARQLSRASQPRSQSSGSHPAVGVSADSPSAPSPAASAASASELAGDSSTSHSDPSGTLSGRFGWPLPLGPAPDEGSLEAQLAAEPERLGLALERLAVARRCRVLLAIDQLEEVFTHVVDGETQRRFAAALVAAADDPASAVRVIFTMRDDFLGQLAHALGNRALRHVTVLGTPERADLLVALQAPLELCGHRFDDPALAEEMVDAVDGQGSALPLLQFTARLLWERRDIEGCVLRRRDYDERGGVVGALARHADQERMTNP